MAKEVRGLWQAAFKAPAGEQGCQEQLEARTGRFWCLSSAEEKQKVPCGGKLMPPPGDQ